MNREALATLINNALKEDVGDGDHSSLSCIPSEAKGQAKLLVKQNCIIAGVAVAEEIFKVVDAQINFTKKIDDGTNVQVGDIVFTVEGSSQSILKAERLALNCMQRMSAIATYTNQVVQLIGETKTTILDTRKTTPNFRVLEKEAVKIGGGANHRFGLYDMIMLKDNHIDYAGGIENAIDKTNNYLAENNKNLKIEIEVRDFNELNQVLTKGSVQRIMLDNFSPDDIKKALNLIDGKYETEASGGITMDNIKAYAETGVDYISMGALTHQVKSVDLSLKAY